MYYLIPEACLPPESELMPRNTTVGTVVLTVSTAPLARASQATKTNTTADTVRNLEGSGTGHARVVSLGSCSEAQQVQPSQVRHAAGIQGADPQAPLAHQPVVV